MSKKITLKETVKPAQKPIATKPSNKEINFFEKNLSGSKGLYAFLGLASIICLIVFKDYIFFQNVYLFKDIGSDTVNASYPQYLNLSEYLRSEGFPKWSFNNGMGQNIFAFILRDPTDAFMYLLGKDSLPYGIIYKELFKILLSGVLFFTYLRKLSLTQFACITGALLFTFSGFMILGSGWYIFTMEALTVVLLLLAFEKLYQDNSWYLFPIAIALIGISQPFNLFVYGLFLVAYIIFRIVLDSKTDIKGFFTLTAKMIGLAIVGLGISAMFLFSNILQLLESPRVGGSASFFNKLFDNPVFGMADAVNNVSAIMRFFSSDLLGTAMGFKGWHNYLEAPMFYCGLLTLMLLPQLFSFLSKREKVIHIVFLAVWILPILFPFFRYSFWLYTGDYYRAFSLCVSTSFIFFSVNALSKIDKIGKVNWIALGVTLIILFILLHYPYFNGNLPIDKDIQTVASILLVVYAILIGLLGVKQFKFPVQVAMILVLVAELSYMSSITANKRSVISSEELKDKTGFNDYTIDAVSYLKYSDKSFYRIDKNYSSGPAIHRSLNDAQAQNFRSTPSYYSFNQLYYVYFLQAADVIHGDVETETRWAPGLMGRPLLESMGSVKYILSKQPDNAQMYAGYDSLTQLGDVKIFRNKNYLPLGFTYRKILAASDFHKLSGLQKDIALLTAFVPDSNDYSKFKNYELYNLKDTNPNFTYDLFSTKVKESLSDTLQIIEYNNNLIKGKINLTKQELLFFSIPYDRGWTAVVDGKEIKPMLVNFGFMGLMLDKGIHQVEMKFEVPFLKYGIIVSLISVLVFALVVLLNKKFKSLI